MEMDLIWQYSISALVTGVIGYLIGMAKDKKAKYDEEQENRERIFQSMIDTNRELVRWRNSMDEDVKMIHDSLAKVNDKLSNVTEGGLAILRDRIIQSCRHFIEQGKISVVARDNIINLHRCYKSWGGNGVTDTYFDNMSKLPVTMESDDSSHSFGPEKMKFED